MVRALCLLVAVGLGLGADLPDPDAIAEALDGSTLAFDRAVDAAELRLDLGHAQLALTGGVLIPVELPGGYPSLEWVFVGRGRLSGRPPDDVEAEQLAHFTGSRSIDIAVREALIIPGGRWEDRGPTGRLVAEIDAAGRAAAERLFREWVDDAEREGFGARSALIRTLLGDPAGRGFAGAWMETPKLGRLSFSFDPASKEPTTFGAYRLYALRDFQTKRRQKEEARMERWREKRGLHRRIPVDEDGAECGQRDDDDDGPPKSPDDVIPWIETWFSAPAPGADPETEPPGFEARHYNIDLTLSGDDLEGNGVARIRLRANADGLRVVRLRLGRGMDVCEVLDPQGRSLGFHERVTSIVLQQDISTLRVIKIFNQTLINRS